MTVQELPEVAVYYNARTGYNNPKLASIFEPIRGPAWLKLQAGDVVWVAAELSPGGKVNGFARATVLSAYARPGCVRVCYRGPRISGRTEDTQYKQDKLYRCTDESRLRRAYAKDERVGMVSVYERM